MATGRYIGEGFDEPRLDTLFLAMPISWRGTLQQYAGRLHRLLENKKEVQVYDYVDIHVGILEKMYRKRLAGYAASGYPGQGGKRPRQNPPISVLDHANLSVSHRDLMNAAREAVIVSPYGYEEASRANAAAPGSDIGECVSSGHQADRCLQRYKPGQPFEVTLARCKTAGVRLLFKANIHQKYGHRPENRVVRQHQSAQLRETPRKPHAVESPNIAQELIKILGNHEVVPNRP